MSAGFRPDLMGTLSFPMLEVLRFLEAGGRIRWDHFMGGVYAAHPRDGATQEPRCRLTDATMQALERRDLVSYSLGEWTLTEQGRAAAEEGSR